MPIYEFRCEACGEVFSEFFRKIQSSEEGEAPACPECGSEDTRRIVSTFAVQEPSGVDPREVAAKKAKEERLASVTPKEMIDKWRGGEGS